MAWSGARCSLRENHQLDARGFVAAPPLASLAALLRRAAAPVGAGGATSVARSISRGFVSLGATSSRQIFLGIAFDLTKNPFGVWGKKGFLSSQYLSNFFAWLKPLSNSAY